MEANTLIDLFTSKDIIDLELGEEIFKNAPKEIQWKVVKTLMEMGWREWFKDEWEADNLHYKVDPEIMIFKMGNQRTVKDDKPGFNVTLVIHGT